ncbi:MAG: hypothetical protein WCV50_01405 [Patescibacteria group bacterium]|jgi:hypothetical protein
MNRSETLESHHFAESEASFSDRFMKELHTREEMGETNKIPEYMASPFSSEIYESDREIKAEDLTFEDMPDFTYYTDTHKVAPQPAREGREGLASSSRDFPILGRLKGLRDAARYYDTLSDVAMHKIRGRIEERFREGGLVVNGGDSIDAFEVSSFLRTASASERYQAACHERAGDLNLPPTNTIWIEGNHDASFSGFDRKIGYNPMERKLGRLGMDEYRGLVQAVKDKYSMRDVLKAWQELHPGSLDDSENNKKAIHPVQRWYLEKLVYGPSIGRYIERGDDQQLKSQVLFLDSELISQSGSLGALKHGLEELGLNEEDGLNKEMVQYRTQQIKAQEVLLNNLINQTSDDVKSTVYAHNPKQMQAGIIEAAMRLSDKFNDKEEARKWVEEHCTIYGGHYHTAHEDIVKMPKGVEPVKGMTRHFIGPWAQRPGGLAKLWTTNPLAGHDNPEILTGRLDDPQKEEVIGVKEEFRRLFNITKKVGRK